MTGLLSTWRRWLACGLSVPAAVVVSLALSGPAAAADSAHANAPLAMGAGLHRAPGSDRVRWVQRRLRALGDVPGPVDGRFGPLTEAAVRRAQRARGLVADGIVGARTAHALRARALLAPGAGDGLPHGSNRVRSLQRQLHALGSHPGPIDGRFGPLTQAAVRRVQRTEGLTADGIVGPRTARRLARLTTATPADQPGASQPPHMPDAARASGGAHGRRTHPGGHDSTNAALIAVLAAIVVALLFAGGVGWRRRRRVSPSRPLGPTAVDHPPKSVHADAPMPQIGLPQEPKAALAARPSPAPREGLVAQRLRAASNGFAERASPHRDNGSPARTGPRPADDSAAWVAPTVRAFGYVGVPAKCAFEPAASAQARAIEVACMAREWTFLGGVREREPALGRLDRPGLEHLLERFELGDANCLVVAELRRINRSAVELGALLDRLARTGVRLLVLDAGVDTGTEGGRRAAVAMIRAGGSEPEAVATGAVPDRPALDANVRNTL